MKRCNYITALTDYSFAELGDVPNQLTLIRHVNVISFDGNKYAKVSFEACGDFLEVKTINIRKLERVIKS